MPTNQNSTSPSIQSPPNQDSEPIDGAVLKLATEAAFLQAFADNLADLTVPVEKVAPAKSEGEIDFGWRAGLRF